jgi:hypothetical protein
VAHAGRGAPFTHLWLHSGASSSYDLTRSAWSWVMVVMSHSCPRGPAPAPVLVTPLQLPGLLRGRDPDGTLGGADAADQAA